MKHKKLLIAFLLCIFCVIYIYVLAIEVIPENIILFQGETLKINKIFGITFVDKNLKYEAIQTSVDEENIEKQNNKKIGTINLQVKLFNLFNVKDIDISVIERAKVIPVGKVSGLKLYTSGVLVVGMSEIKGEDNEKYKPYENSGMQEGDTIVEVDNVEITDTNKLIKTINESKGKKLKIRYMRNGEVLKCSMTPVKTNETEYKLGIWVRDSAAGIGTMTYYEPKNQKFCSIRTWNNRYRYREVIKYCKWRIYNYKSIINYKRTGGESRKNSRSNK